MHRLETLVSDLRFAGRMLRKSPLFTAVAVLAIALGTVAVTTIFSAMNAVLFQPLPGATALDRLASIERTRLCADPSAVGRTVQVNGHPFTLIGVAPKGFRGAFTPLRTDAWAPMTMQPALRPRRDLGDDSQAWLRVFGRLRDGVSVEQASRELATLTAVHAADAGEPEEYRAFTSGRRHGARRARDRCPRAPAPAGGRAGVAGPVPGRTRARLHPPGRAGHRPDLRLDRHRAAARLGAFVRDVGAQ